MYRVTYRRVAIRALSKVPAVMRNRIVDTVSRLAADPDRRDPDVRPLVGTEGFRLHVGKWRIVYHRDDEAKEILVVDLGPRGDVYR